MRLSRNPYSSRPLANARASVATIFLSVLVTACNGSGSGGQILEPMPDGSIDNGDLGVDPVLDGGLDPFGDEDGDGVINRDDNCVYLRNPSQADGDDDSVGDACDNCELVANFRQGDVDDDGIGNACENPSVPTGDDDRDGVINRDDNCWRIPNPSQLDRDGDGLGDACDNCDFMANAAQEDKNRNEVGDECEGLLDPDGDVDGDGVVNAHDNCVATPNPDQKDRDKDHVGDDCDNCAFVANSRQQDSNGDNVGNVCEGLRDPEGDEDSDEVINRLDNCVEHPNSDQADKDHDKDGDECDNCRNVANSRQEDGDHNRIGDACEGLADPEGDADGDTILNHEDNCPSLANKSQDDADKDGKGDACDNCKHVANANDSAIGNENGNACKDVFHSSPDSDHDEIPNNEDNCPATPNPYQEDEDKDLVGDACDTCSEVANTKQGACNEGDYDDDDQDGTPNGLDRCPGFAETDTDGDGTPNDCDECPALANDGETPCPDEDDHDTDSDGHTDSDDNCPTIGNDQLNSDSDRFGDACDNCDHVANDDQADSDENQVGDACDSVENACALGNTSTSEIRPNLYFLIDHSGSLNNDDELGVTRWQRIITALDVVAPDLIEDFNVGVSLYPGNDPVDETFGNCNAPSEVLDLNDYRGHVDSFTTKIPRADPRLANFTPTRLGLMTLRNQAWFDLKDDTEPSRKRAVVLLTDGLPNVPSAPGLCDWDLSDMDGVLSEVDEFAEMGVRVFSVGMIGADAQHMQNVANHGTPGWQPGDPDQEWFNVTSTSDLVAAFNRIRSIAAGCTFAIEDGQGAMGIANYDRARVVLDANGDAPQGETRVASANYTIDTSARTLTLSESSCDALQLAVENNPEAVVRLRIFCETEQCETEVCDGEDNDCDGKEDEGCGCLAKLESCLTSGDGSCDELENDGCDIVICSGHEICNRKDDDCDGRVDEGCDTLCRDLPEICNGINDDVCHDQEVDEGCPLESCEPRAEVCSVPPVDDDCDQVADDGCVTSPPCGFEICNNQDDNCDMQSDEGCELDECGIEICNDLDDDCDGLIDEGCGICQPFLEVCNGLDDDCDGQVDEGCVQCVDPRNEICDGRDNDCDQEIDEECPPLVLN